MAKLTQSKPAKAKLTPLKANRIMRAVAMASIHPSRTGFIADVLDRGNGLIERADLDAFLAMSVAQAVRLSRRGA